MAQIDRWWHDDWGYRNILTTTPTGDAHTSGIHFLRCDIDLQQLVSDGKVRSDYSDVRIICQKSDHIINIPYYIASGCSPYRVFFAAQHDIPANSDIAAFGLNQYYYIYYSNDTTYDTELPNTYVNINFPQAPYSCHPDGYNTQWGTYRDKHFLRFNDNPADGPEIYNDETGHGSGVSYHYNEIQKGHSGILDQCTYFGGDYINSTSGTWIRIPQEANNHWGHPSGDWAIDFWMYWMRQPDGTTNITVFQKNLTEATSRPFPLLFFQTSIPTYEGARPYCRCHYSYQEYLEAVYTTWGVLTSGEWHHMRTAYRTGGDYAYSKIYMYIDGQEVDTSLGENQALYLAELTPCQIGGEIGSSDDDEYFHGYLEQMRYSTFVYPGINYSSPGDEYKCQPDWVDNQYIATLGTLGVAESTSGNIGGILLSQGIDSASGTIGGNLLSYNLDTEVIGGTMWALPAPTSGVMGGYLLCLVPTSGMIGGMSRASRGDIDIHSIESLNRVLIKARSNEVPNQNFGIDSILILNGISYSQFDAKISVDTSSTEEFDALLSVNKIHRNPHVEIIDSTSNYNGYLPCQYTITASGYAFNNNNIAYNSGIHNVTFIWGDNDYSVVDDPVTSGNVWSATHTYAHSGLYTPIVIINDGYGRSGSDAISLNLASGVELPYITLSGVPRAGFVPQPLTVDFTYGVSGTLGTYTIYWDFGNGITYFNNAVNQVGYYALPGNYSPFVRIEDSRGIYVCDTLRIGYNR